MPSILFNSLRLGDIELPNRIVMAPLTRCRTGTNRVPTELNAEYYAQRASAGLILSEATSVSPQGVGYPGTPGIWSNEQVAGWRKVTQAVHARGGRIYLQLWHVGRISDPSYLEGELPVGPSAIAAKGHVSLIRPEKPYVTPRALTIAEIADVVEDFRTGAENARRAGFNGVHVHAANGYLIDQFLQDSSNHRDDDYGGSIENRTRFLLEAIDAVSTIWSPGLIGVHLAPRGDAHDMGDSDPKALFTHVAKELAARKIGFLSAREHHASEPLGPTIRDAFGGPFIANENFSKSDAEKAIEGAEADAVAFGKLYIANPDLVERFEHDASLNEPNPETFYYAGDRPVEEGYIDYPEFQPKQLGVT